MQLFDAQDRAAMHDIGSVAALLKADAGDPGSPCSVVVEDVLGVEEEQAVDFSAPVRRVEITFNPDEVPDPVAGAILEVVGGSSYILGRRILDRGDGLSRGSLTMSARLVAP